MSVARHGSSHGEPDPSPRKLGGVVGTLVDQDLVALICLDHKGAVVESNDRGRDVLLADGGLREQNGRLAAHRFQDAEAFEDLLTAALSGTDDPPRASVAVLGAWPDQRPLTAWVNPVEGSADCNHRIAALVVVVDPWQAIPVNPEQIARSLGLTPAESRVAAALAEGKTVADIARATNRKPESVRQLVKQALSKTWCSRQAELVRVVLSTSRLPIQCRRK